jgi:hypothetical protein
MTVDFDWHEGKFCGAFDLLGFDLELGLGFRHQGVLRDGRTFV